MRAQTRPASDIVVTVRHTDPETRAFLSTAAGGLSLRVVEVREHGVVAAMNAGLAACAGDVIALTDDDAEPWPDWLERIERHFAEDPLLGGVGGRDWQYKGGKLDDGAESRSGELQWWGRVIGNHHHALPGPPRQVAVIKGVNCAYRAGPLREIGFDHRLAGTGAQVHWELSLGLALCRRGWKVVFDPALGVNHYPAVRFDEDQRVRFSSLAQRNASANETLVLAEHLRGVRRFIFLAWALVVGTRAAPGLAQVPRLLLTRESNVLPRWWSTLQGRWAGLKMLRDGPTGSRMQRSSFRAQVMSGSETPLAATRVLFVDHTAIMGGGEIALLNLAIALRESRYQPVALLFSAGPLADRLEAAGIETHVVPMSAGVINARKDELGGGTLLRLKDVGSTLSFIVRLSKWMRQLGVDLVHTNSLKADLIGGAAARLARLPLIWHVRDRIADDYLPSAVVRVFRILCAVLPTRVIAISGAVEETLGLAARRVKVRVVHDGTPVRAELPVASLNGHVPVVGIVGRISPWKGQDVFLRAAAELRQRMSNVRFQIIGAALFGEKNFEAQVRELTRSLGLEGIAEFTGFRADASELIDHLDVLVHASTTGEPFGQVVIEGMAAGKPVVATRGGAIPEIVVEGETGLMVPMGDASAMARAIAALLADPARAMAMGRAGRQRVLNHFTIERTAAQVQEVYDELLTRTR